MNPIVWFEIYVDDMQRAKTFYEQVFGFRLTKMSSGDLEMYGFPGDREGYGTSGALVHTDGFPSGNNSAIVYFSCEDCAVEQSRVANAGGEVHKPKFSIGEHGFVALVTDTERNMIGLHSDK